MNTFDDILFRIRETSKTSSEFAELKDLQESMKNFTKEMMKAERNYDLNLAANIKYGVMQEVQKRIDELKERIKFKVALALKATLEEF